MLSDEQMARINHLARKSRTEGLSREEQDEQTILRGAYLAAFRMQFHQIMEEIQQDDSAAE